MTQETILNAGSAAMVAIMVVFMAAAVYVVIRSLLDLKVEQNHYDTAARECPSCRERRLASETASVSKTKSSRPFSLET